MFHQISATERVVDRGSARGSWRVHGQRGTITAINPQRRAVTVAFDDDTTKTIPAAYLDAGGLDHAYATTVHKAQGQENHLHTARPEHDTEAHHDPEPEDG